MNKPTHLALEAQRRALRQFEEALPLIRLEGEAALRRLLPIARRDSGQSGVVAKFLLGLYNGTRFPFDMTELRRLDLDLFEDCLAVLRMDFAPEKEIHRYFEDGGVLFEDLAVEWGVTDRSPY